MGESEKKRVRYMSPKANTIIVGQPKIFLLFSAAYICALILYIINVYNVFSPLDFSMLNVLEEETDLGDGFSTLFSLKVLKGPTLTKGCPRGTADPVGSLRLCGGREISAHFIYVTYSTPALTPMVLLRPLPAFQLVQV